MRKGIDRVGKRWAGSLGWANAKGQWGVYLDLTHTFCYPFTFLLFFLV